WKCEFEEITVGKGRTIIAGEDLAVITLGPLGHTAKAAIERINAEGHHVALYDLRFLKPLDEEMLHDIGKKFDKIITIEDGVIMGGMGSAILEFMSDHNYYPAIKRLGVPDQFVEHGPVEKLHEICGYDEASIEQTIREQLAQQTKKFR
ncbi:MAG: transketolase C-terminal domain-containing protein, partial [Bacteroides sp.]